MIVQVTKHRFIRVISFLFVFAISSLNSSFSQENLALKIESFLNGVPDKMYFDGNLGYSQTRLIEITAHKGDVIHIKLHASLSGGKWIYYTSSTDNDRIQNQVKEVVTHPASGGLDVDLIFTIPPCFAWPSLGFYFIDLNYIEYFLTFRIFVEDYVVDDFDNDELYISQGLGGRTAIHTRSPFSHRAMRAFNGAIGSFLARIGGGAERSTYIASGDVNGDGRDDAVISYGPITEDTQTPNMVVPRDGDTKEVIGHSFHAFPKGDSLPEEYNGGELHLAVGQYTGGEREQIAVAQGLNGHNMIRLFEYTGKPRPDAYRVVSQFEGISGNHWIENASGGVNLASGDLDLDGRDELIVSQTYSRSSRAMFEVLDVSEEGTVLHRIVSRAFPETATDVPGAGVALTVCDLNGDGEKELVAASQGPSIQAGGQINCISVIKPVLEDRRIVRFEFVDQGVYSVMNEQINPSGVMNISSGELTECDSDGDEVVVSTGSLIRQNGLAIEPVLPAPQSYYRILKIPLQGNKTGKPYSVGPKEQYIGFEDGWNPGSGAVNVAVGQVVKRSLTETPIVSPDANPPMVRLSYRLNDSLTQPLPQYSPRLSLNRTDRLTLFIHAIDLEKNPVDLNRIVFRNGTQIITQVYQVPELKKGRCTLDTVVEIPPLQGFCDPQFTIQITLVSPSDRGQYHDYRIECTLQDLQNLDYNNALSGTYLPKELERDSKRVIHVSTGDINGDGEDDMVLTQGPMMNASEQPYRVYPCVRKTRQVVGNPFYAFVSDSARFPEKESGELTTTVGDFIGSAPKQIAVAQGIRGNNRVRLFQYTGAPVPNAYRMIGEFEGLSGEAGLLNADGGLNMAAGDIDGDGVDELLVGQTYSAMTKAMMQVLDLRPDGTVERRTTVQPDLRTFLKGGAGIDGTVCDFDGDGNKEIVLVVQGGGEGFGPGRDFIVAVPEWKDEVVVGYRYKNLWYNYFLYSSETPLNIYKIDSGEFDDCLWNGDEIHISTGCVYIWNGRAYVPAQAAFDAESHKYRIYKVYDPAYDGKNHFKVLRGGYDYLKGWGLEYALQGESASQKFP